MLHEHSKSCSALSSVDCVQQIDLNWQDTSSVPNVVVSGDSSDVAVDPECNSAAENSPPNAKPVNPNDAVNEFTRSRTNETNSDVRLTTADDSCNLMPEALTPSRLLMHANNTDRNTSEGDKEDDARRGEPVFVSESGAKNRSLSDTGAISKYTEGNKGTYCRCGRIFIACDMKILLKTRSFSIDFRY